jgi:hypothetical protein
MPGNIAVASPSVVMPQSLCLSFIESREFPQLENLYHDGTREVGALASSSRKSFKLSRALPPTPLATLKAFWDSVGGGLKPFYFYNPYEGSPVGANYDATGVGTTGRYVVVFQGNWSQNTEITRTTVPNLALIEVA